MRRIHMLKNIKRNKVTKNNVGAQSKASVSGIGSSEDRLNHYEFMRQRSEQEWESMISQMTSNMDMTKLAAPIYSKQFKFHKKSFQIDVHNEERVVGVLNRDGQGYDAAIQLWHKEKNVIIGIQHHEKCDKRWDNKHVELSDWAKVFTSMVLNAAEQGEMLFVTQDILTGLLAVDARIGSCGIYKVLD